MAYLKVYEWEAGRWPEFRKQVVCRYWQQALVERWADRFNVYAPRIGQSYKRGAARGTAGSYHWSSSTIKVGTRCTLAVLVHEFTHHLNYRTLGASERERRSHGRRFKRALGLVYAAARDVLGKDTAQGI